MLDYLYNAGYKKTFEQLREEVPELVRCRAILLHPAGTYIQGRFHS